jgi:hypothetical protein
MQACTHPAQHGAKLLVQLVEALVKSVATRNHVAAQGIQTSVIAINRLPVADLPGGAASGLADPFASGVRLARTFADGQ